MVVPTQCEPHSDGMDWVCKYLRKASLLHTFLGLEWGRSVELKTVSPPAFPKKVCVIDYWSMLAL